MAPRGISTWRRPHTSIYNDNYRYGTNLYSGTLSDIQKKYTESMSKTQMRSDRPDLNLSTFSGSGLGLSTVASGRDTSQPSTPVTTLPTTVTRDVSSSFRGSVFESMLNSALHSSYAVDSEEKTEKTQEKRTFARAASEQAQPVSKPVNKPAEPPRPTSLYDDPGLFTPKKLTKVSEETIEVKEKKKKATRERETATASPVSQGSPNGPNAAFWKDKCRDLQLQVDELMQAMADMSSKLKGELTTLKGKLHSELSDLHVALEQSSQQSNDLQKTVKKQASQMMELQNSYEDLQRHLQDSLDEITGYQRRNQTLRKEMDRLRLEVEETLEKSRV